MHEAQLLVEKEDQLHFKGMALRASLQVARILAIDQLARQAIRIIFLHDDCDRAAVRKVNVLRAFQGCLERGGFLT